MGDDTRRWGPPFIESENGTKESCYFLSVNRNKKSLAINFQTEKGRDILTQLAMKSDVLLENFVPGKLAKLGLDYDSLKCRPCHFIQIALIFEKNLDKIWIKVYPHFILILSE